MARAELTAKAKLDATQMRGALAGIKKGFADFKKNVAGPIREAGEAMASLAKKAALVSAAVAGVGIKNAFDEERAITSLRQLGLTAEAAKARFDEISDLSMSRTGGAFDPDQYVAAELALRKVGGGALATKAMLMGIANVAARTGGPIDQVAASLAAFYARLKGGADTSRAAITLFKEGIISESALSGIQSAGRDGAAAMAILSREITQTSDSLSLLSATGYGQLTRLKTVIGQAFGKVFEGFAEQFKGVLDRISTYLTRLYNDGTLQAWGEKVARVFGSVLDSIQGIIEWWRALSDEARGSIMTAIKWGLLGVVLMKSGIVGPVFSLLKMLVNGLFSAGASMIAGTATVSGTLLYIVTTAAATIVAYQLGKAIADSLDPTNWFLQNGAKFFIYLDDWAAHVKNTFSNLLDEDAFVAGEKQLDEQLKRSLDGLAENTEQEKKAYDAEGKDFGQRLAENFKANMGNLKDTIVAGLGLDKFFPDFDLNKKFGKMPSLSDSLQIPAANAGILGMGENMALVGDEAKKAAGIMGAFTLRGSYAKFNPGGMVRSAMGASPAASQTAAATDARRAIESVGARQIREQQQSNAYLRDMKNHLNNIDSGQEEGAILG